MYNVCMSPLFCQDAHGAKAGAVYSAAVCLFVVASLICQLIVSWAGLRGDAAAYAGCLCSPVAIAVAAALGSKLCALPLRSVAPLSCSPKYYLIAALSVFGLLFALSPLNGLFVELLRLCGYKPAQTSLPSFKGWGMAGGIAVVALLPAVFEELLFRGYVLRGAAPGTGGMVAIFLSAFVFALYHGSPEQTIYQFACGCLFALLALRSGSVLPSALAHFLNNAAIIVFDGLSLLDAAGNVAMPQAARVAVTVAAALSLAGATAWLVLDKKTVPRGERRQVADFFLWGGAGIGIMALVWVLNLFSL